MVASVIEDLRYHWTAERLKNILAHVARGSAAGDVRTNDSNPGLFANLVEVVPGEADMFCAAVARKVGADVLSDDSDFLIYDLGSEGSLVLMESIECNHNRIGSGDIVASRLRPKHIATRIQIDSIARVAFERASDSGATSAEIQRRARLRSLEGAPLAKYQDFCKTYTPDMDGMFLVPPTYLVSVSLDPRVSELSCQYKYESHPKPPEIFLPLLIEDHARAASWQYGIPYRQLAYSLLNLSVVEAQRHEKIVEHRRVGNRICGQPIPLLSGEDCLKLTTSTASSGSTESLGPLSFSTFTSCAKYAFHLINLQTSHAGRRPPVTRKWQEDFLTNGHVDQKLSWDDIHIYANVQAVLYSLRILKQITEAVKDCFYGRMKEELDTLHALLNPMPSLAELMPNRGEIPSRRAG